MSLLPKKTDVPVNPVASLHEAVDDFFETFGAQLGGFEPRMRNQWLLPWRRSGESMALRPRLDFEKIEDGYMLSLEMPGVEVDDIDISCDGRTLHLHGEKNEIKSEKGKNWYVKERAYGSWFRNIELPEDADADAITAKYHNGVLTVKIPLNPEMKESTRKIDVIAD